MEYLSELIRNIPAGPFALLAAAISVAGALYIRRRISLVAAAVAFRAAINPEAFTGWRGHDLHKALLRDFPAHKEAVVEFRHFLRGKDLLRLEEAWAKYHGGSEDYPDFFAMYCVPENGPQLLRQRLEKLRDAGKHT